MVVLYIIYGIAALGGSLSFSLFVTVPFSIWLAHRLGAIDIPEEEKELKVHSNPVPRLGGVGILPAILVVFAVWLIINPIDLNLQILTVLGSTLLIFLLGVVDDIRGLPQILKFLLEGVIALLFVWSLAGYLTVWLALIIWLALMALTNAYNFIDGIDGLAGGLAVINLLSLASLFFLDGSSSLAILTLACAGACMGFLRFNWHPARVFMGDGGALSLGFLIACFSILYVSTEGWRLNRIIAVLLVTALPAIDVFFTYIRRIVQRQSFHPSTIFPGDRFHFYDQMQAKAGLDTKTTVIICYMAGIVLAALGIVASFLSLSGALLVGLLGTVLLVVLAIRYKISIPGPARNRA